jgi:hypothetical protein
MSATRHDPSRASAATALEVAEAAVQGGLITSNGSRLDHALAAYRAECAVPLRSQAEVNSDLAAKVRAYLRAHEGGHVVQLWQEIETLAAELTAPPQAQPKGVAEAIAVAEYASREHYDFRGLVAAYERAKCGVR